MALGLEKPAEELLADPTAANKLSRHEDRK